MVSFQCDGCADTVKKPKLDQHRQRCWASFTCLDCSTTFQNQESKSHTSCVSEAEKYQGALYKGAKKSSSEHETGNRRDVIPLSIVIALEFSTREFSTQVTFATFGLPADIAQGKQPQPTPSVPSSAPSAVATPTPAESTSSPAGAVGTSAIHPSRQAALAEADSASSSYGGGHAGHAGFAGRGRGAFQRGRGGFGGRGGAYGSQGHASAQGQGQGQRGPRASGENKAIPQGGMRSWGSPAATEEPAEPAPTTSQPGAPGARITNGVEKVNSGAGETGGATAAEKKKNKKKGDKGGTGSKANSKRPKGEGEGEGEGGSEGTATITTTTNTSSAPETSSTTAIVANGDDSKSDSKASKKRKRDANADDNDADVSSPPLRDTPATSHVPEKTLKRLRKNLSKLDASASGSASGSASVPLPLAAFLEQLGRGKTKAKGEKSKSGEKTEKTVETDEVLRGLKVEQVDGKWVITV
ncbi:hypothetical protein EHS25_009348 [Saitozyma podzolica]|uniref:Zinc finger C2H2 LYAR-type domain-containing protein n=1 Tax=Saitozyma podzolica TaxID=1890683 RepID=A0A427YLP6_9TREE|nr:hypothetical protein EHS25_009348 [Saitozyma podzolica]